MSKPSAADLENEVFFEKLTVEVPVYRRRGDRNLYFVDEVTGEVFDQFITVRDMGLGIPKVIKRKGAADGLVRFLLKGAAVVVAGRHLGLPRELSAHLLNLAQDDAKRAQMIYDAFRLGKQGQVREGAIKLIDALGDLAVRDLLDRLSSDDYGPTQEEVMQKLERIVDPSLPEPEPKPDPVADLPPAFPEEDLDF
jgi:hypothetical protein